MPFAHIRGTGSALPERILDNAELETMVETTDEWITRRSGIKERRIAMKENETTSALGALAGRRAMEMAGVTPEQIDMLICGTVTADRVFPSAACMIQRELEAFNAAAYDISAGCSGFLYALESAHNSIRAGKAKTCLVIGTERLSKLLNWKDRGTCVLMGDGAGAVVLCSDDQPGGLYSTHIKSDGRLWDLLYADNGNEPPPENLQGVMYAPYHIKMEGNRLFKQAVPSMASIAELALERNGFRREDLQMVIPHQANLRILQSVSEKLKVPMDKFYTNLQHYGNTSSASIPVAMDEAHRQGLIKQGDLVLLVSFGAGLTWGSALLRWSL
jgi:3-oxoacyl-[acyl-carrier-protein] synthase III